MADVMSTYVQHLSDADLLDLAKKDLVTSQMRAVRVELAKREIAADIESETVPASVTTFADLHDYVDANTYGGLCDGEAIDIDMANAVQNDVDAWLRSGRRA